MTENENVECGWQAGLIYQLCLQYVKGFSLQHNLYEQCRIIHAIVKVKFQPPSWCHCFPLACKKGAWTLTLNNCGSLKAAKEEKASSTWKQPKTIILRSVSLQFTQAQSKQRHQVPCRVSIFNSSAEQWKLWATVALALLIPEADTELDVVGQPLS